MNNLSSNVKRLSYDKASSRVRYVVNMIEPIVKKVLEKKGYEVLKSDIEEDTNGIDLKVINPNTGKLTLIDVKYSNPKNQNTSNFLFTVKSDFGKYYKDKKTDFISFINFPTHEIIFIDIDKISSLIDKSRLMKGNGKYVLLNKDEVRKNGYSLFDKDIVKLN